MSTLGWIWREEAAALPDELPPQLARHVGETNRGRMEIPLQVPERAREVGAELVLERRERGRCPHLVQLPRERGRLVPQRDDLVTIVAGRRLVGREIEALPERPHRRTQSGKVDALARADCDGLDDRRDLGEDLRLRLLVRGNQGEHRFDLGYRIERLERCHPLAELVERPGGREGDEARAARGAEECAPPSRPTRCRAPGGGGDCSRSGRRAARPARARRPRRRVRRRAADAE